MIEKTLWSKKITFKYSHKDYCEYRPYEHPFDKEYKGKGVLICPLRYKEYEDGYSTTYACILDGKEANNMTPCRFKEEKHMYEGRMLSNNLQI